MTGLHRVRVANRGGRATLVDDTHALDVATASSDRFGPEVLGLYEDWDAFLAWAQHQDPATGEAYSPDQLGAAVPRPRQVFGIGLNYARHAGESGFAVPTDPVVFTKFASSLTGPDSEVVLSGPRVDWEAELVVVVGNGGRDIPESSGWDAIAGLTIGQDLSDRTVQFWGNPPQFSLGKSLEGFAPLGPWVVPVGSLAVGLDRDDLGVECSLTSPDGSSRTLQAGRTRDLIFSIPRLVARLSAVIELYPGDIIFTGTPEGVGIGRDPQEFLSPGDVLVTEIEGLGSMRQRFVGKPRDVG